MDPVTMATIASLATGVAGGAAEVGQKVIVDAYEALKAVIQQKYGQKSDLAEAVANVEKKPDSEARKGVLQEEVAAVQAHKDPEVLKTAQALLDQLQVQPWVSPIFVRKCPLRT